MQPMQQNYNMQQNHYQGGGDGGMMGGGMEAMHQGQMGGQMGGQIGGQMGGQMGGPMGGQMGGQMGGGQMGGGQMGGGQVGGAPQQSMASAAQPPTGEQNFDYMFKLLIIGNSSVGKTSFLFRYSDNSFAASFVSTVGIDFKVKTVQQQGKNIKLQIWDTAGQERYRTITTAYYRGAMGFILMYDITNEDSFNAVCDWCTQIKAYSWDNAQVILVGNKSDMEHERVVSTERGKRLADQLGLEFYESSAKDNVNVGVVFDRLVFLICDRMARSLDAGGSAPNMGLPPNVVGGGAPSGAKKLTDMANPAQLASQCQKC